MNSITFSQSTPVSREVNSQQILFEGNPLGELTFTPDGVILGFEGETQLPNGSLHIVEGEPLSSIAVVLGVDN